MRIFIFYFEYVFFLLIISSLGISPMSQNVRHTYIKMSLPGVLKGFSALVLSPKVYLGAAS